VPDKQGDVIEVGNITGSGIAIGAKAVASVVNVYFGGVIPTLDLHALREQLAVCGAPRKALEAVDKALAGLPYAEAAYRQLLRRAYGAWCDIFVDLDMHADEVRRGRLYSAAFWMQPEFCAVQHIGPRQVERVKLDHLSEALERYPAIALLGEPGAGKTTAMRHLAGELAQKDQDRLPLLVDLARYRHDDLLSFIADAWPATLAQSPGLSDDVAAVRAVTDPLLAHLQGYLKEGRLVLLLDALNEMPLAQGYSLRRERLRAFIDRWQKRGNRFIVSCRVLDYAGSELSGLQQVEIDRLPVERVGRALVAYLPDKGPELWEQLQRPRHRPLLDLLRTPYFLAMLAAIYAKTDVPSALPIGQAALLEQFTAILFEREARKGYPDWVEAPAQRVALGVLAYRMQLEDQDGTSGTAIPLAQARAYLPDRVTVSGRQWDLVPDVLLRLAAAASLMHIDLDERGNWRYVHFCHQLLQECFTAGELERRFAAGEDLAAVLRGFHWPEVEMPAVEQPTGGYEPLPPLLISAWDETLALLAGLTSDVDGLVKELIRLDPFVAACCAGARLDSLRSLRADVADQLVEALTSQRVAALVGSVRNVFSPWWKRAVDAYELALLLVQEYSPNWAHVQSNLGIAYSNLPIDDRADNLERAIAAFQAALKVRTRAESPVDWAALQNHLGNAYVQRIRGDRAENLERAVAAFTAAFQVFTRASFPVAWAMTQNNLASALRERVRGDRAYNVEEAIVACESALMVYTRDRFPVRWASVQNNLGAALHKRRFGDRAENLERAIAACRAALQVLTRVAFPRQWAGIQYNLGIAYSMRVRGDKVENLAQAFEHFRATLRVYTPEVAPYDYAAAQHHLGNVYSGLPRGDFAQNQKQAIDCFQEALRFYTLGATPLEYAATQNDLAITYYEMLTGDRGLNLARAVDCFQEALHVYTPQTAPYECRRVSHNLANIHFAQGDWRSALVVYRTALPAAENIYAASILAESKRIEIAENAALYRRAAFVASRLGYTGEAVLILEQGKTRTIAERLARDDVQLQKATPEDQKAYCDLIGRLKSLEAEQRLGDDDRSLAESRRPYTEIAKEVERIRQDLATLIQHIRGYLPDFLPSPLDFTAIQALVPNERTALVVFCVTEKGSVALVIRARGEPEAVWIDGFTQSDLNRIVRDWVTAYLSGDQLQWQATIERVLNEIGLVLLTPLHKVLQKHGITNVILLPQGGLFLLPLHAVPLEEGGTYMVDHYEVSYVPSAAVLQRCYERAAHARVRGLFAVADPTNELPVSEAEVRAIASLFGEFRTILWGEAATKESTLQLAGGHGYVHFSCHGHYDWDDPSRSALVLAGGLAEERRLTLAEVEETLDLSQTRLVTLAASEVGLSDAAGPLAEEYVGLPAGFLLAGAPAVVAPLWSVEDFSTALLMERFYCYHLHGGPIGGPISPATALRQAQIWLRGVTAEMAAEICFQKAQEALQARDDRAFRLTQGAFLHYDRMPPDSCPFAHPFYWAPFMICGV
jgi:CHAT domain-containing protein